MGRGTEVCRTCKIFATKVYQFFFAGIFCRFPWMTIANDAGFSGSVGCGMVCERFSLLTIKRYQGGVSAGWVTAL